MKTRKLCGYDLNGWSDRAARNWSLGADGDEVSGNHLTGRVLRSSVVRVGTAKGPRWIGGAQAALAPHGKGGGWGEVGRVERRRLTLDTMRDDGTEVAQLAAALSGLATGPNVSVVAIAEGPETTERLQERLVDAMGKARLGRGLLVWRSVLAVLTLQGLNEGAQIGVLGHVSGGFTLQHLRLRQVLTPTGPVLAPERERAADFVACGLGYEGLFQAAKAGTQVSHDLREDWASASRAVAEAALTGSAAPELYRNARRDFVQLTPPDTLRLPAGAPDAFASLAACDVILLETLTEGALRADLIADLKRVLPRPPVASPPEAVAQGALLAAERIALGLPIYFDFLPQISTIVLGEDAAENYDLIDASETLPAGQIYRSPKPARFAIQAGQSSVSVHIRKELATWPRRARIELGVALPTTVPVELRVEQAPAAGRARLIVEAPSLSRQFTLDWETAEEVARPWEELLAELGEMEATIPDRLVLPCGTLPWDGMTSTGGLSQALQDNTALRRPDWKTLATRLAARPKRTYAISSDGAVPGAVHEADITRLDRLTLQALEIVKAQAAGRPTEDNEVLKFLTWQFRRAPTEVPRLLLDALMARHLDRGHPFARHQASWTLVYQGFGRTCRDADQEREALSIILSRPVTDWTYRQETAALAFLLSRSDSAPRHLERADVETIGQRVLMEFKSELGTEYTKFLYAPFLLGGLLRWRLKHRNALVVGRDPLADKLKVALETTRTDLTHRPRRNATMQAIADRYIPLLIQLTDELEGHGGNPDLLMSLYDAGSAAGPAG